ncbi:hypothetical protein D6D01_03959 [Aureobasidium pullulans]|uniref:Uncharacterized protein n=1 Tax=Aureobasidium pullulans TaxID=5580 RepID=A0A4S9LFF9_AURPU|nr:hypothetical protein D6D01_03959 [Aureobasidium pullulans]
MAQYRSIYGQYSQESCYGAPPTEHWQDCPSLMTLPPYAASRGGYVPAPFEPKMAYSSNSHVQLRPAHSLPAYQPQFAAHQRNFYSSSSDMGRPVVIPQIAPGTAPFTRAYSPSLASMGIDITTFLNFLDTLNIALSPAPPLQIIDLAGGIMGMVPHHIPALVGGGLQASAKIAGAVTSKARSKAVLEKANKEVFGPRGMKMEIVDTAELKRRLGITGSLLGTLDEQSSVLSVQQRRLKVLEPCTASLDLDVPMPEQQANAIDRLSAAQLKRQMAKAEEKALKQRMKEGKKADRKAERRAEREEKGKDKDGRKDKREAKGEKQDKESKAAEKLLWLFIGQV